MTDHTTKTPLPPIESRVYVTGTRHNGFYGTAKRHEGRCVWVELDEWPGEQHKFYYHNLWVGAF